MADDIDPEGTVETTEDPGQNQNQNQNDQQAKMVSNTGEAWHCGTCKFVTRNRKADCVQVNGEHCCPDCFRPVISGSC